MTVGKQNAQHRSYTPNRAERVICWLLLATLVVIAVGIGSRQAVFNPAVLVSQIVQRVEPAALPTTNPAAVPLELKPFGPPEQFSPDNLYDKIDGKAELYLAAGFVQMHCQRFALQAAPDEWFEWFVYDMGGLPQAFSVFSTQRRSEGRPLDLTPYAYRTRNGLYFVWGQDYIEAVASAEDERLTDAMLAMGARFVAAKPAAPTRLSQLDLFPQANLVPASYTLQTSDAFGFDQLKNVFTAQYKVAGTEFMAFLTTCTNHAAAESLSTAYRGFLLANGGKAASSSKSSDTPIGIMGTFEFVFVEGNFVGGVHAAPAVEPAQQLTQQLRQHLAGVASSRSELPSK